MLPLGAGWKYMHVGAAGTGREEGEITTPLPRSLNLPRHVLKPLGSFLFLSIIPLPMQQNCIFSAWLRSFEQALLLSTAVYLD